ncbi:MAG TPA: substrate-binding domain-containing protein [Hydrogenophaga sp.]
MVTQPSALRGISSMATRLLLGELVQAFEAMGGESVAFESVGGVDAARRVAEGESFDLVVLASDAIDKLTAAGHLQAGSRVDVVRSGVSVAVRQGAPHPDISSEAALRQAVLAADTVGYSTGPSGVALLKQFDAWGVTDALKGRLVQARPGVPVASMVASGEVALGFQQLSELLNVKGIEIVGPLPEVVQIVTTFSAGVPNALSHDPQRLAAVRAFLDFVCSPAVDAVKRRHGMAPV